MFDINASKICIVGLGYVGLPLAISFSKVYPCIGFDKDEKRISNLKSGIDETNQVDSLKIKGSKLNLTSNKKDIENCNIYIITVPTPVDEFNNPDLSSVESASLLVASYLTEGDIVIYESTVYPGATEEICVPILEKASNLKFGKDFRVGYSPERINPGDNEHTLEKIVKVVSGNDKLTCSYLKELYESIISAGVYCASSIKVAEAAKVIENTQRDINIAFVNELAILFNKLDISTHEVLQAASTKWNFSNFQPGLVGGHCIGVDPYYLTHKAKQVGFHPEMILAGRRINDEMPEYISNRITKEIFKRNKKINSVKLLIMGITFKEDCPDLRNSKSLHLHNILSESGFDIDVYDPWFSKGLDKPKDLRIVNELKDNYYDGLIFAVPHKEILEMSKSKLNNILKPNSFIFDIKSRLNFYENVITL